MAPFTKRQPQTGPRSKPTKRKKRVPKPKKPKSKGPSAHWLKKIQKWLQQYRGPEQTSFFDPLKRQGWTVNGIKKFYSDKNNVMRLKGWHFDSRENFAKYAINEVLQSPNDAGFAELTRDIIRVADGLPLSSEYGCSSGAAKDRQTLIEQVKLEDIAFRIGEIVDKEDISRSVPVSHSNEMSQQLSIISQTLLSASPNSLGPPLNPCIQYLKLKEVRDRGDGLKEWKSLFIPTLDGKGGHKALLDNQVTAIVWILSRFFGRLPILRRPNRGRFDPPESDTDRDNRENLAGPPYRGGILADSMGLGKTITTVATLSLIAEQGLHIWDDQGISVHRPILLLTPNSTVTRQWIFEILQNTNYGAFRKVITSGKGLEKIPSARTFSGIDTSRLFVLTAKQFNSQTWKNSDYIWNENDKRAAQVIIVMSIDTWAHRTCKGVKLDDGSKIYSPVFTEQWRRFSIVAVDEAHRVKNNKTKLWSSVDLLERQFTLLITATPSLNTVADLYGLAGLLSAAPEEFVAQNPSYEKCGLESLEQLDRVSSSDPLHLLAGHLPVIGKLTNKGSTFTQKFDLVTTRRYLKRFEQLAMLQRAPTSSIPHNWSGEDTLLLKGLFPKVRNRTIMIEPPKYFAKKYQKTHAVLFLRYIKALQILFKSDKDNESAKEETSSAAKADVPKDKDSRLGVVYRNFAIASASLDLYRLQESLEKNGFSTKIDALVTMRKNGVALIDLAHVLRDSKGTTSPKTAVDHVKLAVRLSPVLRQVLAYILENILDRAPNGKIKKLLITEDIPALAWYYEIVLQFLGLKCRTLHSALSPEDRQELVEDFNSGSPESCQILIQMYKVGAAGTNLHHNCSRVLVATQSHSLRMQGQATHRVIRFGQTEEVDVCRIIVRNSFHEFRESRQVDKLLPELSARAQYGTNSHFVALLNAFSSESWQAWNTEEGRILRKRKYLLAPLQTPDLSEDVKPSEILEPLSGLCGWQVWGENKAQQDMAFFLHMTRHGYYDQYQSLSDDEKIQFDHNKNVLRRLMAYSAHNGQRVRRNFTAKDLDKPHFLERALELQIRVQLGADRLAMLPLPQANLPFVSKVRIRELEDEIGLVKKFEYDYDKKIKSHLIIEEDLDDLENDEELEDDEKDEGDDNYQGSLRGFVVSDTAPLLKDDDGDDEDMDKEDSKIRPLPSYSKPSIQEEPNRSVKKEPDTETHVGSSTSPQSSSQGKYSQGDSVDDPIDLD